VIIKSVTKLSLSLLSLYLLSGVAKGGEISSDYVAPGGKVAHGKAPGMQIQLLGEEGGRKQYAVIFGEGDEVISGLTDFAEKYQVKSAHFKAIGGWQKATLGWFSREKKMYKKIPVYSQVEVASMIGDIAIYKGKPIVHTHAVIGLPDGATKAGHVLSAEVWPTLEVMVTVEPNAMERHLDPKTGITLISPNSSKR
jgi:predicted DNA-binding protein with PD1-like motif